MFELEIVYWHVDMKICLVSIKIKEGTGYEYDANVFIALTRIIQSLYYSPASRCINSSSESADRGRSIIQVIIAWVLLTWIILRPLSTLSLDEGLNALSGKNPSGCWLVQPTNQMSDISKYAH